MGSIRRKALAAVLIAGVAAAAEARPGNGIGVGAEGRLHPFVDLELRYDSNVSYSERDEAIGDLILHARPGVELKLPGDLAALELSGAMDWAQYLGMEGETSGLSRMYGEARMAARFVPRRRVSVRVDDEFRRQVSTTSLSAAATAVVSNANTFTVSVPWTPGGGALVVAANGQWILETFERYEDERGAPDVGELGYNELRGGAEVQWRFLPRTTAVVQGAYYSRVPRGGDAAVDASGFDVWSGFTGLVTERVSATVKGGYGGTSAGYASGSAREASWQKPLADVAVEWLLMDSLSLRAGYDRKLGVDPSVAAYLSSGLSAGGRLRISDRFAVRAGVRYDRLTFQGIPGAETKYLRVDPTLEGMVGRWVQVGLGYVFSSRSASWPSATPPDYSKNEAFLRVGLTY